MSANSIVPSQLLEYTEAEAREYVARLDAWVESKWPPDHQSLATILPVSRALRGALQMARLDSLSPLAEQVERVMAALHSRRLQWSTELGGVLRVAISDLREQVPSLREASDSDQARITQRVAELAPYARPPEPAAAADPVVPITTLFHSDSGQHILYVPVTPQTRFEQQLRELAPGAPLDTEPAVPGASPPRGVELQRLLQKSVARLAESFRPAVEEENEEGVVPIEALQYSGRAALERARELTRAVRRGDSRNSPELLAELADVLELAEKT